MRRINLATLGKKGLIQSGDILVWQRKSENKVHKVVITPEYFLQSGDRIFRTPSSAAKFFNDNKPVNGWFVWKLQDQKVSLEKLRIKSRSINKQ